MIHYGITVRYVTRRSMLENTFEVFSSAIKHHGPLYDYMRDDTKHPRVLRAGVAEPYRSTCRAIELYERTLTAATLGTSQNGNTRVLYDQCDWRHYDVATV